jgi:hypothetical protein
MFHLAFLLALYFLPTLIASGRHLHERGAIAMLNVFLGWTFIGWVIALIWAITAPTPYYYYVQPPPPPYYPPSYPPRYR